LKEVGLKTAESVAIPGAFNVGGEATARIPAKFAKSATKIITARDDEAEEENKTENALTTIINDPATGLPIAVVAGGAMLMVAGAAGASYYLYRWYKGADKNEDAGAADGQVIVQSDVSSEPAVGVK
jgi:uncharacterized protein YodC (DUF2158 family)